MGSTLGGDKMKSIVKYFTDRIFWWWEHEDKNIRDFSIAILFFCCVDYLIISIFVGGIFGKKVLFLFTVAAFLAVFFLIFWMGCYLIQRKKEEHERRERKIKTEARQGIRAIEEYLKETSRRNN